MFRKPVDPDDESGREMRGVDPPYPLSDPLDGLEDIPGCEVRPEEEEELPDRGAEFFCLSLLLSA